MINLNSVDRFLKAVRTAKDYNSKEIRLTISEADALSDGISQMLLQERDLTNKIMQLQDQIINMGQSQPTPTGMNLSGGTF